MSGLLDEHSVVSGSMDGDSWAFVLTDEDRDSIERIARQFITQNAFPLEDDLFLTEIELLNQSIPRHLARKLVRFRKYSNDYGMLLLRNLPVDTSLPSTPTDGSMYQRNKLTHQSECNLLLLMSFLGDPIAYAEEKGGTLIHNICPVEGQEQRQENTGSIYLEFHTENGFHPYMPDFLGLFCLRADHDQQAKTATASIRRAIGKMSSPIIETLRRPLFHTRLASSFRHSKADDSLYSSPIPVLSGDWLEPDLCIDFFAMEAITPAATYALNFLRKALEDVIVETVLTPGDMLIIDNRTAVHARTAFQPRYDGEDRWLQRLFVMRDFHLSRKSRLGNSHVCSPLSIELAL